MQIKELVASLEQTDSFADFAKRHPEHYLVHIFSSASEQASPPELGYYSKETDQITVFHTNPVQELPPEPVFKETGVLKALDLDTVQIGVEDAVEKAKAYTLEGYPNQIITKTISILQQKDVPVWNMTVITAAFSMINIRIDATNGKMLGRTMTSIMSLIRE